MVTGSHNPPEYNGVKMMISGHTLAGDDIQQVRAAIEGGRYTDGAGIAQSCEVLPGYVARVTADVRPARRLRIAVDCGNGAAGPAAKALFSRMDCELTCLYCDVDGRFPNHHPNPSVAENMAALQQRVRDNELDIGFALDGDGDRVLMVAGDGRLVDGDELLFIIADGLHRRGALRGGVVGTEMSNLGLETALRERGIGFERAAVGDRYVMQKMADRGWTLGGEPAGHIICLDKTTTGDAIIASLVVLQTLAESGADLGAAAAAVRKCPQVLVNVPLHRRLDGQAPEVERAAAKARQALGDGGRVLVRASGTEPLLRIMVESQLEDTSRLWAGRIADEARRSLGA